MQDVRSYCSTKLHTTANSALKCISQHTYKNHVILSENLVQTNHFTPIIKHDQPIAVGVSILELSKLKMYDFWYNKLTKDTDCKFDLCMSDTGN